MLFLLGGLRPLEERLQKVLAQAGVASRRACEELIKEGKVKVNGKVVTQLGTKINPVKDKVEVAGKKLAAREEKVYLLLYKPVGYLSSVKDPKKRRTVMDLIKDVNERVYPVGRLDHDTEGLLLLTNDGELTYALTHPKHEVDKTYLAWVEGIPSAQKLEELRQGVNLEDGPTAPARVKLLDKQQDHALLEIVIHEGRNRQVRRMCEHIGHPVTALHRSRLGFLTLEGLGKGKYRYLAGKEIKQLKILAGIMKEQDKKTRRKTEGNVEKISRNVRK
ncbi:MAG: pseudouridine synthase [Clostridia bacterium]|nr:pseudouridine synthase [Clostridia bacterium]